METALFNRIAAAYVRGALQGADIPPDSALFSAPLDELDDQALAALVQLGRERELRLHRFKRTMGLARVRMTLGILRGIGPENLLDIGSGRGAFLWPLLDAFPWLPVTAVDTLEYRVRDLRLVASGGLSHLTALTADATNLPFADRSFDVVTMLEVLEHIQDTAAALRSALRAARRFLVISAPSKPDNNPEHIHLFSVARLEELLREHGAARTSFEFVPGHLIAVARVNA